MLPSLTPWLIVLGALLLVALGWALHRAALTVGGAAAAARGAEGLVHAYEVWARFGPLRVELDRLWDDRQSRLVVQLFGWRLVNRQLDDKPAEPKETKALARRDERGRRVEVDWLELALWALERRYLVALDRVEAFVRFGLADAARTGELSGLLWALRDQLPRPFDLTHEAVFDREVLEAEGSGTVRIYPIPMVCWLAWFVLSRVRFYTRPRRLQAAEEK